MRITVGIVVLCAAVGLLFGQWEPDQRLTDDLACDYVPGIAASDERVHLLWCGDSPGNYEVFYKQNPTGSVAAETPNAEARTPTSTGATTIRGSLDLPFDICNLVSDITLLDITGRRVMRLRPGPNDVSPCRPASTSCSRQSTIGNRR